MLATASQSTERVIDLIRPGDSVFIHSAAATPMTLVDALVSRAKSLRHLRIIHIHTEGHAKYASRELADVFNIDAFFVGQNVRKAVEEGRADYIPAFLSEIPTLIRSRQVPVDVALISVSPVDKHGYVSLGPSVDTTLAAVQSARLVIAQVNRHIPRVMGEGQIPFSMIDRYIEADEPLPETVPPPPSEEVKQIGRNIAEIVPDGATLQTGIGSIPNAVLEQLSNHKDLGVHTEMFSDGLLPLIESGVVTNAKKKVHPGYVVSTFALGSKRLYDFMDDHPRVMLRDATFTNSINIISKNPKVTAINGAIEIDLTGQICADSIGTRIYSGVGGQIDFMRGAAASEGGMPIIAMTSRTPHGESKIVPKLQPGAGVVTTRPSVHYVATEYGIVNLYGKSLKERAAGLISVAHPDDREMLERFAYERWRGRFEE
ncbi:MAG: acetyl-CoA hydrolase/transferase family protein [Planctomycetales bacterium]|nr:acetyl-CoA hydrolase/transferase family protein [Planctomycetales bacterium]